MITTYIGLGSNLDDPLHQVERAIAQLNRIEQSRLTQFSPFYRSTAVGPGPQPDYINAVAELETDLPAEQLLDQLQTIENNQGRIRGKQRWIARTLDLDILLYGNQLIETERLTIPHPFLTQRNFVVFPLFDLAPQLRLPDGTPLSDLAASLSREGISLLEA